MTNFLKFLKRTQKTSPIVNSPVQEIVAEDIMAEKFNNMDSSVIMEQLATNIKDANILFVDDNRDLLTFVSSVLVDYAKNVYTAIDAYKALDCLTINHVDIVVSDVMMPGMDGFELCKYIKNNVLISHIPVILLTARVDKASQEEGYKNGADDYVLKPFKEETLINSICTLLKRRSDAKDIFLSSGSSIAEISTYSTADEAFMNKFHGFVCERSSDPNFGVEELANLMEMSHSMLYNKVLQLTGMNPNNYIGRVRLEDAITLLKTSSLSMAEIAEKTGFSNPRYFSTAFKTYTGTSPLKYRKQ